MSRIYGGIHFNFDNTAGLELGRRIGTAAMDRTLNERTTHRVTKNSLLHGQR